MTATRKWGKLCPDGHGLLLEHDTWSARGVVWCPHLDHGGNGRFYRTNEAQEGYAGTAANTPTSPTTNEKIALARERREAARRLREENTMNATQPKPAATTPASKEPKSCLCGCGGTTKGGRFLPGHDARYHSRLKREAAEAAAKAAAKMERQAKAAAKAHDASADA